MCLPCTFEALADPEPESTAPPGPAPGATRRGLLLGAGTGAAALAAGFPQRALAAPRRPRRRIARDLTHPFRAGFPVYTGDTPTRRTLTTIEADGFYSQAWTFGEHSGTHLDAPGHFAAGGRLVDALTPAELMAPVAVIDVSARAARDPDTAVQVSDLRAYQRRHGRMPRGSVVLMHSGWAARAGDPVAFKNADASGTYHFPGWGLEAVEWLIDRGRAVAIGVDTLSLDIGASTTFDVHKRWLGADRYGIENVANLETIPVDGARVSVGVIPWQEGSGGPCRLLASY